MLIEEFSFGNFRSFKDIQTLRMSAARRDSKNKKLDTQNVLTVNDKTKVLKSKVIYGANASGKSNIINALFCFKHIILQCLKNSTILNLVHPFMYSTETMKEPSFFQLIFYIDNIKYRYGFELTHQEILNEWLYATPNRREVPVFIREGQNIIEISKTYISIGYEISKLKSKLFTEKILFLSLIDSINDNLAEKIVKNISDILISSVAVNEAINSSIPNFFKNTNDILEIFDFVKYADTNIVSLESEKNENSEDENKTVIRSSHYVYDENHNAVSLASAYFETIESDGTQQMLSLSPFILQALKCGNPVFIDEFGSKLHPLLTKKIFSLFNSENNNKSQIIAATHTTELMSSDLLRKDQIDFVEKDTYGRSYLYTLVEIKDIRNTASFENDYFKGKYGAIPFLGNWEELEKICDQTEDQQNEEK